MACNGSIIYSRNVTCESAKYKLSLVLKFKTLCTNSINCDPEAECFFLHLDILGALDSRVDFDDAVAALEDGGDIIETECVHLHSRAFLVTHALFHSTLFAHNGCVLPVVEVPTAVVVLSSMQQASTHPRLQPSVQFAPARRHRDRPAHLLQTSVGGCFELAEAGALSHSTFL